MASQHPSDSEVQARRSPYAVLLAVGFAVFVAADDLTVVTTMLRPIIGDLGLVVPDDLDDAAWIVNVYLIAFVAVMPVAGRVSDVVGRRRTFVAAYLLFMVGTVVIPTADTMQTLLIGRVLTAVGGGAMVPVAMAVVGDAFPEDRRARALGTLGAIETMGWVWGPLYGAALVRFLDWRWQFWLNVPLALVGLALVWRILGDYDRPSTAVRVDWIGAAALTIGLVAMNVALLGNAEIQSVTGLDELTGRGGRPDYRWLFIPAMASVAFLVWHERRSEHPIIDRKLFAGRNVRVALAVNFVVGAVLIIAMVDVPIFVNAVKGDLEHAAVVAGWVLSALTACMAITSYAGGRLTERFWYRPPVLLGLGAVTIAFVLMGITWEPDTSAWLLAAQLALLGAGLGLVVAPTTAAVVDAAPAEDRGAAAGMVMVVRLIGLSVGLSALTAWGLARFNALQDDLVLPPIDDPTFPDALSDASGELTANAIGETFLASAVIAALGIGVALIMQRHRHTGPTEGVVMDTGTGSLPGNEVDGRARPQQAWYSRNAGWLALCAAGVAVVACVVAVVALGVAGDARSRLDGTEAELASTKDDLLRVEGGAALFAAQVQAFQDQLVDLEPALSSGLDEAIAGLDTFRNSTIEFRVPIDETIEIDTEIAIKQTVEVPISEVIEIDRTVSTTIDVETPLGFSVPVDVNVPVKLDVPIELDLTVPVDEVVPIKVDVPVKLDVPISIDVAGTELAVLADSLAEGLRSLEGLLSGLGG